MEENVIAVHTLDDQEQVAQMFSNYDFLALPVVDNEHRTVGIVTIDDAIDVIQEEATEDIEKMAAVLPSDKPYMKTGVFGIYAKRVPWLLVLMLSANRCTSSFDCRSMCSASLRAVRRPMPGSELKASTACSSRCEG